MMSPSPGGSQRLTHRRDQPVVHRDHDPLARHHRHAVAAGHLGDLAGPHSARVDRRTRPPPPRPPPRRWSCMRAPVTRSPSRSTSVTQWWVRMRAPYASAERALPHSSFQASTAASSHLEGPGDARVDARLARQRLGGGDLLHRHAGGVAAGQERVGVVGVVGRAWSRTGRRCPRSPAPRCAQGGVLLGALGGRLRVGRDVPAPGVQQAVEAARRALPEVDPLHEHRPEAPHGDVANDPEAGRAAADDEDVTLDGRRGYSSSTQSNVRVTAFFQWRYSRSRFSGSMFGVQRLSSTQFSRRSSCSFQKPTARPAA